jgi:hypothetical protein
MMSDVNDNMMATCNSIWNEVHRVQLKAKKQQLTLMNKWKSELITFLIQYKLNSVAFSPQVNYTDRATADCRRS